MFARERVFAAALALALVGCGSVTPTQGPPVATPEAAVPSATPTSSPAPTPSPTPLPTPSGGPVEPGPTLGPDADYAPLDGVLAGPADRLRLPVAVMVDDNVQARPQYGFNAASIVYQAPADGGETRYMMVFQEREAKRVEPVRSGRPYFVNWAMEYRGAFAHYGGDAKTIYYLPAVDKKGLWDVDALRGSGSAFHRDKSRKAPHNGVTSSAAVRKRAIKRGAPATIAPSLRVRVFADDLPMDERPAKGSIMIPYNRGATSYTYDRVRNLYLRSVAGKAQKDAADGRRVTARNVVVLFMGLSIDPESEPHHNRPLLDHVGSGRALVFRDGHVIAATWRKPLRWALTRFHDADGREITLVRGPIFIQVVPTVAKVTYDAKTLD